MHLGEAVLQELRFEAALNGSQAVGGVYTLPPIIAKNRRSCTTCKALDTEHTTPRALGSMSEIRARYLDGCPTCRSFILICSVRAADDDEMRVSTSYDEARSQLAITYDGPARVEPWLVDPNGVLEVRGPRTVWFRRVQAANPHQQSGRDFRHDGVDLGLLRNWIGRCTSTHGPSCNMPSSHIATARLPARPTLNFVDLVEQRLVTPRRHVPYVALSYVWGMVNTTKTTRELLPRLRRPGSLSDSSEFVIARTIRDAMKLAHSLGAQYLWVDSLSIIQDDPNFQAHIDAMGQIYHNASFTIVVANGDANTGISGIGGNSGLRREEHVLRFPQSTFAISAQPPVAKLLHSDWAWRAWTYQEYLFSRRILIVNGEHRLMSWKCPTAEWSEEAIRPSELIQIPIPPPVYGSISSIPTWPDLISFGHIVSSYSTKDLTYEDDVFSAFSGISTVLESSFRCRFVYGLPVAFLDLALLWTPTCGVHRRICIRGTSFPSWSWMGWVGGISYGMLENAAGEWVYDASPMVTTPVATWQLISIPPDSEGGMHGPSEGLALQSSSVLRSLGISENPRTAPHGSMWIHRNDERYPGCSYFTHPAAPGARFRYPVSSIFDYDLRHGDSLPGTHLVSKVQKAELAIANVSSHAPHIYLPTQNRAFHITDADILSENGDLVGIIPVDVSDFEQPNGRRSYTFIAISQSFVLENVGDEPPLPGLTEMQDNRRQPVGDSYHFYNVLWIEWERGIAYRKALGRVFKEFWDSQPREEITVILG